LMVAFIMWSDCRYPERSAFLMNSFSERNPQMSENNETDLNATDLSRDRVGDILRKERITRRITVETIAKDLKLNVKYIKALEASEYEALPADPYVRVYLRSLAKYLSLDSEEILKKFYMERGMSIEKETASKISVSMKEKEETKSPMLITVLILIALLAGFSFLANKKGWISTTDYFFTESDTTLQITQDNLTDSLADDDSMFSETPLQQTDSSSALLADTMVDTTGLLSLQLDVISDSAWVQVFSDGTSWKNIIAKNQSRIFTAKDSFNVHVGNNSTVKYSFKGKPITVRGTGIVAFKLDKTGKPIIWTLSKWNSVFKERL
jgi:cytoskeletal protein RodZ